MASCKIILGTLSYSHTDRYAIENILKVLKFTWYSFIDLVAVETSCAEPFEVTPNDLG